MWRPVKVHEPFWWRHLPPWAVRASVMLLIVLAALLCALLLLRIRCGITASILLFVPSPSHGLISLVPWDSTASVADLETVAVNSPRILSVRIEVVQLRRVDQSGQDRPGPGPALTASEERILSAQSNRPDGALNRVRVHLDPAVLQEHGETGPVAEHILDRLNQA